MFSQNIATKCFFTQMCWMGIGGLLLRHHMISKHTFENNNVTMPSEEDNQGDDNKD
jgi:hypothetical protein